MIACLPARPSRSFSLEPIPRPLLTLPLLQPHLTTALMNQIPGILYADEDFTTWLIVGASRGIGLEFVRQLLNCNERIIATVREPFASHASGLWGQAGSDHGRCQMYVCDILSEESIVVRRRITVMTTNDGLTRIRNSYNSLLQYQTSKSTT